MSDDERLIVPDDLVRAVRRQLAIEGTANPNGEGTRDVDRLRERLHVGRAVCNLPAPTPLVDGLLYDPGESVLYGPPKSGKSFLALALNLSVATGQPFMGRDVKRGRALYVAAEGVGGLGQRVDAWCQYHNVDDIDDAMFLTTAVNLTDHGAVNALCDLAKDENPSLVTLDTLARCAVGAEENSAKDMGRLVDALDQLRDATDGHIKVVHHSGKDITKGMRGSNALLGAVDTVLEVTGDPRTIQVKVTDQKEGPKAAAWWCRLEPVGESAVIVPTSDIEVVGLSRNAVLDALESLPPEDRTATKWQEMAEEKGVSRATYFRTKKNLIDAGWVEGGGRRGALYIVRDDGDDSET
jgi:hypothetical protein